MRSLTLSHWLTWENQLPRYARRPRHPPQPARISRHQLPRPARRGNWCPPARRGDPRRPPETPSPSGDTGSVMSNSDEFSDYESDNNEYQLPASYMKKLRRLEKRVTSQCDPSNPPVFPAVVSITQPKSRNTPTTGSRASSSCQPAS